MYSTALRLVGTFLTSIMAETLQQAVHTYRNRPQCYLKYRSAKKMLNWDYGWLFLRMRTKIILRVSFVIRIPPIPLSNKIWKEETKISPPPPQVETFYSLQLTFPFAIFSFALCHSHHFICSCL